MAEDHQISLDVNVSEMLFNAIMRKPVEEYVGDLEDVVEEEINVKNSSGRTMLHQAVLLGKTDWVREILKAGADQTVEDGDGRTVLQVAKEMFSKHAGEKERRDIVELVQNSIESEGDSRTRSCPAEFAGASMGTRRLILKSEESLKNAFSNEIASFKESTSETLNVIHALLNSMKLSHEEMMGVLLSMKESHEGMKGELHSMKESHEGMKGELYSMKESHEGMKGELHSMKESHKGMKGELHSMKESHEEMKGVLLSMKESHEGMKGELHSMKESHEGMKGELYSMKESHEGMKGELHSMKESHKGMKGELHSMKESHEEMKGVLLSMKESHEEVKGELHSMKESHEGMKGELHSMKESHEGMKGELHSMKESHKEMKDELTTTIAELQTKIKSVSRKVDDMRPIYILMYPEEALREYIIKEMMQKTKVLPSNAENDSKMRTWYERLYDEDPFLSSILKFLQFQRVEVHVDFESEGVGRMKPKVRDHDGIEESGSDYGSFADFEERKAYVGGLFDEWTMSYLARALSQLSVLLAFNNKGLPYSEDGERERELYKGILEEAERKKRDGEELDGYIKNWSMNKWTEMGKEICLHAVVPGIIARYGSSEGKSILNEQLPVMLKYFEDHVVVKLRQETMKWIARESTKLQYNAFSYI